MVLRDDADLRQSDLIGAVIQLGCNDSLLSIAIARLIPLSLALQDPVIDESLSCVIVPTNSSLAKT